MRRSQRAQRRWEERSAARPAGWMVASASIGAARDPPVCVFEGVFELGREGAERVALVGPAVPAARAQHRVAVALDLDERRRLCRVAADRTVLRLRRAALIASVARSRPPATGRASTRPRRRPPRQSRPCGGTSTGSRRRAGWPFSRLASAEIRDARPGGGGRARSGSHGMSGGEGRHARRLAALRRRRAAPPARTSASAAGADAPACDVLDADEAPTTRARRHRPPARPASSENSTCRSRRDPATSSPPRRRRRRAPTIPTTPSSSRTSVALGLADHAQRPAERREEAHAPAEGEVLLGPISSDRRRPPPARDASHAIGARRTARTPSCASVNSREARVLELHRRRPGRAAPASASRDGAPAILLARRLDEGDLGLNAARRQAPSGS